MATAFYTPAEIFAIFKEQHRLASPLDAMANPSFNLTRNSVIVDWQDSLDLLPWYELSLALNEKFRVEIPTKGWKRAMRPELTRTIWDVCVLLSKYARKDVVESVTLLGNPCLTGAVFLNLKNNLKERGVDVSDLKPSTYVEPFLEKNYSALLDEVTLTGVKTFSKIELGERVRQRRNRIFLDRLIPKWIYPRSLKTGEIQTFRELVGKIIANEKLPDI